MRTIVALTLLALCLAGVALAECHPIDVECVWRGAVEQAARIASTHNALCATWYQNGYANSQRNWREKLVKIPPPSPGALLTVDVDWSKRTISFTAGPEPCVPPLDAPWVVEPQPGPAGAAAGFVEFVDPEDGGDYLLAGNSNVPDGHVAEYAGRKWRFTVIGKPGSIVYRKLWIPILP